MKTRIALWLLIAFTTVYAQSANAQQSQPPDELKKVEVGVDFSTIFGERTHPGVGARLTYNLNRHIAVEGAAIFSPNTCQFFCASEATGTITQGMFGIKAGHRFKKFGLFVKARPGVVNLSHAEFQLVPNGNTKTFLNGLSNESPFTLVTRSRTDFAMDLGGVLEIYPKKNFFLRFDAGALIERVGSRTFHSYQSNQTNGSFQPFPIPVPGSTIGHVQLTTGIGFRF
jgi:hypothetical protein